MINNSLFSKILSDDDTDPKARIAKAAIEEFALRSLDGARTREIAKKSGTNIAAISYHFGGKEELYKTVIRETSIYFDSEVAPYYSEGQNIIKEQSAIKARELVKKFLIGCIARFSEVKIVRHLCIIMIREESSPSEAFRPIFESIYEKPVRFIADMLSIAAKGKLQRDMALVFSQALWSNVRAYSAKNDAVLKLHGWKSIGKGEIAIIAAALDKVIEKTLQ